MRRSSLTKEVFFKDLNFLKFPEQVFSKHLLEAATESYSLTQQHSVLSFYIPWKHQKTMCVLIFSGCIKCENWILMGYSILSQCSTHGKPGGWFAIAKCLKSKCGTAIILVKMQIVTCLFIESVFLRSKFFRHFASKSRLPGFFIGGILAWNELK